MDCPGCGAKDGSTHKLFCVNEPCPFCSGRFASCECLVEAIRLNGKVQINGKAWSDFIKRWNTASTDRTPDRVMALDARP